jgi:formylglycine-generating enzyme required for sulfatase activity
MKRLPGGKVTVRRGYYHREERIDVPPYLLDVDLVTVAQYRACVRAGACPTKGIAAGEVLTVCNWNLPGLAQDPITCVWKDHAEAYCRWAGKRPVKTQEWVLAVTGGGERRYPWGNTVEEKHVLDMGPCRDAARGYYVWTCPVSRPSTTDSLEGIRGLVGLVHEWTRDDPAPVVREGAKDCWDSLASSMMPKSGCGRMADVFRCAKDLAP